MDDRLRHLGDRVDIACEHQGRCAHAGRGQRGLHAGMTGAADNHIIGLAVVRRRQLERISTDCDPTGRPRRLSTRVRKPISTCMAATIAAIVGVLADDVPRSASGPESTQERSVE